MRNKYEDLNILELENIEDIVGAFIACSLDSEYHGQTTAIIADKELIEYALSEIIQLDTFNVKKIAIEDENLSYMISTDVQGNIVVQPIESFNDKNFKDIGIVYISMDDDVEQDIINACVNEDKDVTLFGLEDK